MFSCSIASTVREESQLAWPQLQRISDEQLMACLQAGDNDALAVLFDRYQKLVLNVALKIVRNPFEAEDVT